MLDDDNFGVRNSTQACSRRCKTNEVPPSGTLADLKDSIDMIAPLLAGDGGAAVGDGGGVRAAGRQRYRGTRQR